MATTIKQQAWFGVGVFGVDSYGVASITYVPDGVEATTSFGSFSFVGEANISIDGVESVIAINSVDVAANADVLVNGVESFGSVGNFVVAANSLASLDGVSVTSFIAAVAVVTTAFDYEAIKENYETERTVYVEGRVDRLVYVDGVPRIVFVESSRTPYDRAAKVARETRQVYVNRGTTSEERIVVVEE